MALFTTQTGQKARAAWQKKYQRTFEERLWAKIKKGAPDECWPWTGTCPRYGMIRNRDGKGSLAHREVWKLVKGEIPPKIEVCHTCDNPPCCNPKHLFLGTHKANMEDAINKRRFVFVKHRIRRGENNAVSLLTDAKVVAIRSEFAGGKATIRGLAPKYGVSASTIASVVSGRAWSHIPNRRQDNMRRRGERHPNTPFTEKDIRKMRSDYASGVKQTFIAKRFGVAQGTIQRIVTRQTWKHVL